MAIIKVTLNVSTPTSITARKDDVVVLQGVTSISYNGFNVKSVHSEDETSFFIDEAGKYITPQGVLQVTVNGQSTDEDNLRAALGLDFKFPDNHARISDIGEGGSGGGDFDPSKYYTKVKTDERFVNKDERFKWELTEVGSRGTEANKQLLDELKSVGRYAVYFNEKGEVLPSKEYGFLLVTQRSDTKDIRQEYSYIDPHYSAGETSVYFAYRYHEEATGKWSKWAVIDSIGSSVDAYTKVESDEKYASKSKVGSLEGDIANMRHDLELRPTEEELDIKLANKANKVPVSKFDVDRTISDMYVKDIAPPEYPQIAERRGNYIFVTQSFRVKMGFPIGIGSSNPFFKIPVEHAPTMRRSCTLGVIIRHKTTDSWSYMNLVGVILPDGSVLPMSPPNGSTMIPDDSIVSFQAEYTIAYNAEGNRPPDPVQGIVGDNILSDDIRALADDYVEMHERVDVIYNGAEAVKEDVVTLKDTIKDLTNRLSKLEGGN